MHVVDNSLYHCPIFHNIGDCSQPFMFYFTQTFSSNFEVEIVNSIIAEELDFVRTTGNKFINAGTNRYEADTWKKDNVFAEDSNDNFDLDDDFAKKLGEFFS